jgi:hypothetical protein
VTQSIDARTRAKATTPPESESDIISRSRLVVGVRVFTGATTTAGLGMLLHVFTYTDWRSGLAAATFFILAVLGGSILTIDALLAERREFYQRGQLDGWMQCLHGQPPEVDDPLLRR